MGQGDPVVTAPRLFSRGWVAAVVLPLSCGVGAGVMALFLADGVARLTYAGIGLSAAALLVAVVRSMVLPRRRRELSTDADGTVVIESPALIVWPVVVSCLVLYAAALGLALLLVLGSDDLESPGAAVVGAIGAVMGAPDMFRLVTGRLQRWRLILGPDGFTYRGYRTVETVPWSKVHGASIQRGKDAGVLIDRKGTGPDRLIPILAFDVPAEQVLEEVEARAGSRRR
jgi:hypothetical protein